MRRGTRVAKTSGANPIRPGCTRVGLKDLEGQAKRLHQFAAFSADGAVDLNAEAITQFGVFLEIVLNRRVGDMGAEGRVIGVNLRPHERLGIVWILIKGVVNHSWLRGLHGGIGDAGQFQILLNTTGFDVDARQQQEGRGLIEAGHGLSGDV